MPADRAAAIRMLNDFLRQTGLGGRVVITRGIEHLGAEAVTACIDAVRTFDAFDEHNDPWSEHDCAVLHVRGADIMFKIDYYDRAFQTGSPDPANPQVTGRLLTILLTEEY